MKRYLIQDLRRFIGGNGSSIIALSSMLIALVSLVVAIQSQGRDREYKELAIRPHVAVGAHVSDFSFGYTNAGYGHAFIDRISFGYDGKCYSSDRLSEDAFDEAYSKFIEQAANDLYISGAPSDMDRKIKSFNVTLDPLLVGGTIRAGEKYSMFYFEPDTLKALLAVNSEILTRYRNAFAKAASKLPLSVRYCSATGLYCEDVTTQNPVCPLSL